MQQNLNALGAGKTSKPAPRAVKTFRAPPAPSKYENKQSQPKLYGPTKQPLLSNYIADFLRAQLTMRDAVPAV